uniref:Uncharacterized protein n=1 Tax=Chromera velia CCMP2878 TaxID=1169474 RepID=A0A0G4HZ82_9ALVE|eukprot:Cvel_9668.t1-p1 / transcript=Cvel_9668.t1 / gene=Cvel_9668 / organism=Chromera_velia_CCMP2878 / gene_product=hypothetical protein / transcript_product=hypothetical protein / location=Cvel_scaffold563:30785-33796(+) / protein_length=870 / sequence_SO=supercontig / SO=protein_coding / is_pseudo=false
MVHRLFRLFFPILVTILLNCCAKDVTDTHETPFLPHSAKPAVEQTQVQGLPSSSAVVSEHACPNNQNVELHKAIKCYNEKYRVSASVARETVRDLSQTLDEFYAFWGLADDPQASQQNFTGRTVFPIFGESSPLGKNFADLVETLPKEKGATVGIQEVSSRVNEIVISLRDHHVKSLLSKMFNGETGGLYLTLLVKIRHKEGKRKRTKWVREFQVKTTGDGTPCLAIDTKLGEEKVEIQFTQIDGLPAFDWFVQTVVKPPIFDSADHKAIGTRTNSMLSVNFGGMSTAKCGDIGALKASPFPARVNVVSKEGSGVREGVEVDLQWKAKVKESACPDLKKAQQRGEPSQVMQSILDLIEGREGEHRNYTTAADFLHSLPDRLLWQRPAPRERAASSGFLKASPSVFQKTDGSNATHIYDSDGELSGRTRCFKEKKFCVLALATFGIKKEDRPRLWNAWNALVKEARENGITKLILNVNKNGGGKLQLAYAFLAKLFPSAPGKEICPFLRIRLGPLSRLLSQHGLLGKEGREARKSALKDKEALKRTVKEWKKKDCQRGLGAHNNFQAAMKGLLYFIEDVYDPTVDDIAENDIEKIKKMLKENDIKEKFQEAADQCANGTLNTNTLEKVASAVNDLLKVWTPFEKKIDFVGSEWKEWGGAERLYTRPLDSWMNQCTANFQKSNAGEPTHPFKKIIFFSGGFSCVSSCDVFTTSAPTTAPGGFVKGENMQNRLWVWFLLFRWFAETTGSPLLPDLDEVQKLLPPIPFAMEKTPRITRAAGFQQTWGEAALPAEFFEVPTDFQLNEWFSHLKKSDWLDVDSSQMTSVYEEEILPLFEEEEWRGSGKEPAHKETSRSALYERVDSTGLPENTILE